MDGALPDFSQKYNGDGLLALDTIVPYSMHGDSKAILPPCQVCGAPASGFHYGTNTCEACKVFFRRSLTKHTDYRCKNGRNQCSSTEDFVFNCKSCRFRRCISEGMSKDRIKIGRYSRERRQQNLNKLSAIISKKPSIPYLMNFADADIVTVYCRESYSKFRGVIWSKEIDDLYNRINSVLLEMSNNTYPRNDFMDVLEVCGIELDGRRNLMEIAGNFWRKNLMYLYSFARDLPGGKELPEDDFLSHFFEQTEDVKLAMVAAYQHFRDEKDFLNFQIDDQLFKISRKECENIFDKDLTKIIYEGTRRKNELHLTPEESMFLFATHIIKPKPNFPQLSIANQRLSLAFTRYLQTTYGDNYHNRLRDLINFVSFFKESVFTMKKWMSKNVSYLNFVCQCKITRLLWQEKKPGWELEFFAEYSKT